MTAGRDDGPPGEVQHVAVQKGVQKLKSPFIQKESKKEHILDLGLV